MVVACIYAPIDFIGIIYAYESHGCKKEALFC